MRKNMLLMVFIVLLAVIAAGCGNAEKEAGNENNLEVEGNEEDTNTTDASDDIGEMIYDEEEEMPKLLISLRQIVDPSNVILKFQTDPAGEEFWGATDVPNYKVTNEAGEEQIILYVVSSFNELETDNHDTFRMSFKSPLEPGTYTAEISNHIDSQARVYETVTVTFDIEEEGSAEAAPETKPEATPEAKPEAKPEATPDAASEGLPGLDVSIAKVVDNKNVIVKFNKGGFFGATDAPNYEVKDEAGNMQAISSVASAFVEMGGDENALETFKLTFGSELKPGKYTVTAKDMIDSLTDNANKFASSTATFTIE